MPKIVHLTYQDKYSGIKIAGEKPVPIPTGTNKNSHMQKAFYLMSQLEAPLYGTIQSYDGAAMSGGPAHWIAVAPKTMEQGQLFGLLRRIEMVPGAPVKDLWEAFKAQGWYVAKDGKLRNITTGALISGKEIRNTFTPPDGKVPSSGPQRKQAETWALLFYNLLSDPKTFAAQADYAIEYLVKSCASVELQAYKLFLPKIQFPEKIGLEPELILPSEVDLAMCVYHSFSPNAPGIAQQCLQTVLTKVGNKPTPLDFSKLLIKTLGTKKYGRWADLPGNTGNRYDWTRNACIKSGLWPKELLDSLMPENF